MRQSSFFMLLIACYAIQGSHSSAQTARETTTGTADSATAGSTTEGIGGLTTEGLDAGSNVGGVAGSNAAPGFVGSATTEGFVGGGRESTTNSAFDRFFREIAGGDVPTGGTQESSGSPRRVPVTLRLGFAAPPPRAVVVLAGVGGTSLRQFLTARPDLSGVSISMDDTGNATLVGQVSKSSTRRLAANLIRLQPGVKRVQNRIEVREPNAVTN